MHICLDSDESKLIQVQDIAKFNSLSELLNHCKKSMNLPANFDSAMYGFKTTKQNIILSEIGEILKSKRGNQNRTTEDFQTDKDFYDENLS